MIKESISRDWEKIEFDYRAGIKTIRVIAEEHGITHGAVNKRARRDGWTRDISAKVKARAEELVSKKLVSKEVSKNQRIAEKEVVEANATMQADIILAHRTDIQSKRNLVSKLFAEVEGLTDGKDIVETLTLALHQGDQKQLANIASKIATLPSRIKGASDLVNALKTLISMEREAFGIKSDTTPIEEFSEIIRRIVKE